MVLTDSVTQEQIERAVADPRNKVVALHRPGSSVVLPTGEEYICQANGSWARAKSKGELQREADLRAAREMLLRAQEGPMTPSVPAPARDRLALAVVLWDGASEDGCSFCDGEWRGGGHLEVPAFILHDARCPVVGHRLELIGSLIDADPAPDTDLGKRLLALTVAQERYERARFAPEKPEDV